METQQYALTGTATANCEAVASAGNRSGQPESYWVDAETFVHLQDEFMGVQATLELLLLAVQSLQAPPTGVLEAAMRDMSQRLAGLDHLLGNIGLGVRA